MKDSPFRLPSKKQRESLASAVTAHHANVAQCVPYLTGRGFTEESIGRAQFGYVVDPPDGREYLRGRLSIPYLTPSGPVYVKYRCLQAHSCGEVDCPKYVGEEGRRHIYNVLALRTDSPVIAITEGELDAVMATQCGIPAVGVPGVKGWRPEWQHLFEGFEEVLLLADGDTPGRSFADKMRSRLYHGRIVEMPDGLDVSSFVLSHGSRALRERAGLDGHHDSRNARAG